MPTLRTPVSGSSVCTNGSVTKRPPSCGQHFSTGNRSNRAASPCKTTCWHTPRPLTSRGSQRDMRPSNGSIRNLSNRSGLGEVSAAKSSSIRPVSRSTDSTPSAMAIRRSEPIILVSTGNGVPVFSNNSARPPPGLFASRSVNSAISNTGSTGTLIRTSSPARSNAAIYSLNVLYITFY